METRSKTENKMAESSVTPRSSTPCSETEVNETIIATPIATQLLAMMQDMKLRLDALEQTSKAVSVGSAVMNTKAQLAISPSAMPSDTALLVPEAIVRNKMSDLVSMEDVNVASACIAPVMQTNTTPANRTYDTVPPSIDAVRGSLCTYTTVSTTGPGATWSTQPMPERSHTNEWNRHGMYSYLTPATDVPMSMNFSAPTQQAYNRQTNIPYRQQPTHVTQLSPRKLLELPEFTGRPEEWPVFYTAYMESTAYYGYSPLENTLRLQKCLKGAARAEVESLLVSPQNTADIINNLQFRFGQPERLVKSQLAVIKEVMPIPENRWDRLVPFATKVKNFTAFLKAVNAVNYLHNPTILDELLSKLPTSKTIEWTSYSMQIQPYATLEHFDRWINGEAKVIIKALPNVPIKESASTSHGPPSSKRPILTVNDDSKRENNVRRCTECSGEHSLSQCNVFKKKKVQERWDIVKNHRLCFSCLKRGHSVYHCKQKKVCGIYGCNKSHNKLLHNEASEATSKNDAVSTNDNRMVNKIESSVQCINTIQTEPFNPKTTKLLFKILPIELRAKNGRVVNTFALIDDGSSCTLINESIARKLQVTNELSQLTLQWFGGKEADVTSMAVEVKIKGTKGNMKWCNLKARTVPNLKLPTQTINLQQLHERYHQIKNLPIAEYINAEPTVLIGIDNCQLTASLMNIRCEQAIIATKTPLGWLIYGKVNDSKKWPTKAQLSVILHTNVIEEINDDVNALITDYFTTENFGINMRKRPIESEEVIRAKKIMASTTVRIGNKFESGLLWKKDELAMPDSYEMALNRFYAIEKKMSRSPEFKRSYSSLMENFLQSGYARKLSPSEAQLNTNMTWYLPHFVVVNVNKPGKLRLVFDAAATVNDISLNSTLLKGPDDMPPLIKILQQFRERAIGICADIKEMFLQVQIRKEDQNSQRFVWRQSSNEDIETYVMTSMIFGATCSPSIAQYVKNQNAVETAADDLKVVSAIVNNHYVDDFVCSFDTVDEALEVAKAVKATHLKAGFTLRNFISNCKAIQEDLNNDAAFKTEVNMNTKDCVDKVLGMYWSSEEDAFIFKLRLIRVDPLILNGKRCPTKREFLSLVMSVYDPFGMLADYLIYGKVLLQSLWRKNVAWDEGIPQDIYKEFTQWIDKLKCVEQAKIARCYSPRFTNVNTKIELHIFVDASQQAFAAVAYWRFVVDDIAYVRFVMGKTRCAPLKLLSIPRLELQAAVLGTRLKTSIIDSHTVRPKRTIFWTDSKTVLCWIKSDHRQYKQFVAHRVGEILDASAENDWRWLPTSLNVADVATRATYPLKSEHNQQWLSGPNFLTDPEDCWPSSNDPLPETCDERKRCCLRMVLNEKIIEYQRFHNYLRLKRTVGWIIRFVTATGHHIIKEQTARCTDELSVEELHKAEMMLCHLVQNVAFSKEIAELKNKGTVSKNSDIFQLTPQLDEENILRVQGRLDYATILPSIARKPIILPYRHELTELIVRWYHERLYHQNTELVINEIRQKFWIPNLRSAVKRAQSNCQLCKNRHAQPKPPMMGQLPKDRVTPYVRPFTYCGLDYFGPIFVTVRKRIEKRWAALFTCLTVRAVHIELAADLSTDSCIICIRNFVNRRGIPIKIRSDMGTNFVGASREIQRAEKMFDVKYIQNELSTKGIIWEFNCPGNPSSGGCWERLIQSTKRVLAVTLKERAPQVETLRCLLIEAENIINSRPLTHLPVSPLDSEPLTPNHFILGTLNSTQTPGDETLLASKKQYRISQQLKNNFWRRWIREYLPTLTKRTKWFSQQAPIQIGNMVLVCEENVRRSDWKKGIVVKTIPAKDGHIRLVDIRTTTGIIRRPVSKLAVLDIDGETIPVVSREVECCEATN